MNRKWVWESWCCRTCWSRSCCWNNIRAIPKEPFLVVSFGELAGAARLAVLHARTERKRLFESMRANIVAKHVVETLRFTFDLFVETGCVALAEIWACSSIKTLACAAIASVASLMSYCTFIFIGKTHHLYSYFRRDNYLCRQAISGGQHLCNLWHNFLIPDDDNNRIFSRILFPDQHVFKRKNVQNNLFHLQDGFINPLVEKKR